MKGLVYLLFDIAYYMVALGCVIGTLVVVKQTHRRILAAMAVAVAFLSIPVAKRASFEFAQRRFQHLCATQAGERIPWTVDGVRGIVVMRPREEMREGDLHALRKDQFALDDPYSFDAGEVRDIAELYLYDYEFIEFPARKADVAGGVPAGSYVRMTRFRDGGYANKSTGISRECSNYYVARYQDASLPIRPECMLETYSVKVESIAALSARYGYTWSEITTRDDREKWIGGGTVEIRDLHTGRTLATKTGFLFAHFIRVSPNLEVWSVTDRFNDRQCPAEGGTRRTLPFIRKVLRPKSGLGMDKARVISPATARVLEEIRRRPR